MARGNAREHLFQDRVKQKKYFYVLRPLFAIRYIEAGLGVPPVRFSELVESVAPTSLLAPIEKLLELKRNAPEIGLGDRMPEINSFVEAEFERHGTDFTGLGRPEMLRSGELRGDLNSIFRCAVKESSD